MSALNLPSRADWKHRYALYDADGQPEDISAATASIVLTRQSSGAVVTLALGTGLEAPGATNAIDILVDRATKAAWPAGLTTAEILLAWPDGYEESVYVDLLNVHAAGAPTEGGVTNVYRSADTTRIVRVASGPPGPEASEEAVVAAALLAVRGGVAADLDTLAKLATALQTLDNAKANRAVTVTGAGLATGGGDLSASRTITVPKADSAQAVAGLADDLALTPAGMAAYVAGQRGVANGLASLDASGQIPSGQLPPIAITRPFVVASQAAMLALTAQEGDVCIRTDQAKTYILSSGDPTQLASWYWMQTPTDLVLSVNGQTGAVNLTKADVGLGSVENTALSTWAGSANLTTLGTVGNPAFTGTLTIDGDVKLSRPAANTLALSNGANAQAFRVFNSTNGTDSEFAHLAWQSNEFRIGTLATGAGVGRALTFVTNGSGRLQLTASGNLNPVAANSYDLGSASLNYRNGYFGGTVTATGFSGTSYDLSTSGSFIRWNTRVMITAPSVGVVRLTDAAQSDFSRLILGLNDELSPSIRRNGTTMQARTGSDGDWGGFQGKLQTHTNAVPGTITPTHTLTLYDAAGAAYRVPCAV